MIEAIDIREPRATANMPAERRLWTVLVPVDGLAAPGATIGRLAPLLSGHRLVVVATWRSVKPVAGMARAAMPGAMVALGAARMDEESSRAAERVAADAAAVARECGIDAAVRTPRLTGGWGPELAALAERERVDAVLLGRPCRALERRLRHAGIVTLMAAPPERAAVAQPPASAPA